MHGGAHLPPHPSYPSIAAFDEDHVSRGRWRFSEGARAVRAIRTHSSFCNPNRNAILATCAHKVYA